jgi:hypothetical protein
MEEGPRLNLVTTLPLSVWREHLRPLLRREEVVRLRRVCKATKVLVTEWPMELGVLTERTLEPALTCFPATKSMILGLKALSPAEECRLVGLLRGHGGTLKDVVAYGKGAQQLLSSAVRAGALPTLTHTNFFLDDPIHREILSGGMLRLLEGVQVTIYSGHGEQVAALESLRHLPRLQTLRLNCYEKQRTAPPPFIPSSLKSLVLRFITLDAHDALLPELPSMLQASGADIEEFEISACQGPAIHSGAALAQILQACSSTLKVPRLRVSDDWTRALDTACVPAIAMGLTSCCDTLEVLHCPWAVFRALPPTCPTFPRLAELRLQGLGGHGHRSTARPRDLLSG